jgi:hypothetical protein
LRTLMLLLLPKQIQESQSTSICKERGCGCSWPD